MQFRIRIGTSHSLPFNFLYFVLQEPVQIKKGEKIEIAVWRLENEKIVWYEWLLCTPAAGAVHNSNGKSYFIGLT